MSSFLIIRKFLQNCNQQTGSRLTCGYEKAATGQWQPEEKKSIFSFFLIHERIVSLLDKGELLIRRLYIFLFSSLIRDDLGNENILIAILTATVAPRLVVVLVMKSDEQCILIIPDGDDHLFLVVKRIAILIRELDDRRISVFQEFFLICHCYHLCYKI